MMEAKLSNQYRFGVNTKLLSFTFAAIVVVVVLQALLNIQYAQQRNKVDEQELLTAIYSGFNSEVELLKRTAMALAEDFANRADVRRYISTNDRWSLLATLIPVYNTLKADYDTPYLYVLDENGTVFLRVDDPTISGDSFVDTHQTLVEAIETGQAVSSVELNPNRLGVSGIAPILQNDSMVGLVEVDLDYNLSFLEKLKTLNNADYTIWLTQDAIEQTGGWSFDDEALASASTQLLYYTGTYSTAMPISEAVYDDVLASGIPQTRYVSVNGEAVAAWIAPIQDHSGQTIGVLEIVRSRATALNALRDDQFKIMIMAVLLLALVVVAIGFVTNSVVLHPLRHLTVVTRQQLQGDLTARVKLLPKDEFGQLGNTFNHMTDELAHLIENLEQRVKERTRDLDVASEVSKQLTRVLDINKLLPNLTNLTRDGFGLLHVSVFLYESSNSVLRLAAASGEVGATMLTESRHFHLGDKGLVPRAGRTNKPVIVNHVGKSDEFMPNPLLPNTQSEVALPMSMGEQLLGVLDLQSDQPGYFTDEYVNVLVALAEQITIAVRNAQLFKEVGIARDESERANTVKSAFLASMSHELRTPLNAVLNFSQFLSSGMLGSVNDEQVDMLNKISASGKHLLNLINDVLDISKIEAGSLRLFIEENVDLVQEVEVVADTGRALLADKPIVLRTEVNPDAPTIAADKRRVRQILLNLVSNACKFTETGEIVISLHRQDGEVCLSVRDTGPGIAREDYEAVFEAFRQSSAGVRQGTGTGLGLAISRRLAEAHGGRLWLESELGRGSIFHVALPVHSQVLIQVKETENGR